MVGELASKQAVPFFPDKGSQRQKDAPPNAEATDFDSSLEKAISKEPAKPKSMPRSLAKAEDVPKDDGARESEGTAQRRLDKPKVMNREPFFPRTPMPYHPEPETVVYQAPVMAVAGQGQPEVVNESDVGFELPMLDESPGYDFNDDDLSGIIAQSYDAAAVIYPMKQIAPEAMPESVLKNSQSDSQSQNLWKVAPLVVAQPNPKVDLMNQMVSQEKAPLPVSKPVAQFMASMESELGVTPNEIVQAFEKLPEGEMLKSPEETLSQVVKNLDLPKEDQAKAKEIYSKLVTDLRDDVVQQSQPKDAPLVMPKAAALAAYHKAEGETVKRPMEMPAAPQSVKGLSQVSSAPETQPAQQMDNRNGQDLANQSGQQSGGFELAGQDKGDTFTEAVKPAKLEKSVSKKDAPTSFKTDAPAPDLGGPLKPAVPMAAMDSASLEARPVDANQRLEAMREIAGQAHLLAQKGGGEMQMTLRPEHLGEIQLKVVMDGGRLDVQMVADRQETKKLLEQNVHELKHSLASHNLGITALDVSVQDKNAGFQNQRFDQQQSAREMAQQFSQNLNQNLNHGQSQGHNQFFQQQGSDAYAPTRGRVAAKAQAAQSVARRGVSSGRLNVVA